MVGDKTVEESIVYPLEVNHVPHGVIEEKLKEVLERTHMTHKRGEKVHTLSGGEKQKVVIARALISNPEFIIADEPTGNLDPVSTHDVIEILKKINDLGTTVILTTHNKGVVEFVKSRVITMEGGKVARDDKQGKYAI